MRFAWSAYIENLVLLARQLVIVDEERFKFLDEWFTKLVDMFHGGVTVVVLFDRHNPIVPRGLVAVFLFALDDSDRTARQHTT